MLHRTARSTVLALSILGISQLGFSSPACIATAQAEDLELRFDEIEAFASTQSPQAQILAQGLRASEAQRDDALQWSNPSISYDLEEYAPFTEWELTLGKRFVMPFSQGDLRRGWEDRLRSDSLRVQQESVALLAELKLGYVQLRLLDSYTSHLEDLSNLVQSTSTTAGHRHAEGEISGVGRQLIGLSAFSVQTTLRRARQVRSEQVAVWRSQMGIASGAQLELTTPIRYEPVRLRASAEYLAQLGTQPGIRSQAAMAESWGKRSDAARPDLIPAFDIYGGFKRFEPDFDGFVAGVSIDLPLFDRKAGASRGFDAARVVAENEVRMALASGTEEISSLLTSIELAQESLDSFSGGLDELEPLSEALLLSYREGSLDLDVLLNAILIQLDAVERYYLELADYYHKLFRLEVLTGDAVVRFES